MLEVQIKYGVKLRDTLDASRITYLMNGGSK